MPELETAKAFFGGMRNMFVVMADQKVVVMNQKIGSAQKNAPQVLCLDMEAFETITDTSML